ncbi:MAG: hypothetical protein JWP81_3507 [Ferruginibacter sp.]|nr:hypothetical protein [Ferruginibacter sp.]
MKLNFFDSLLFFQWACMIASATISLKLIGNKRTPEYMNKFYLYSLIAGVYSIYAISQKYFHFTSKHTLDLFGTVLLIFHFIFLSSFIYGVLPNKKLSFLSKLMFTSLLIAVIFFIFIDNIYIAIALTNFSLVVFCCFYYLQLFEKMPSVILLKEPSFWVINGIFFCMCATIPVYSLRDYFFTNYPYDLFLTIGCIISFSYGMMHLFFIKAYLCSTSLPKA